ncbi:hypothetical protein FRX31_031570, partial [Thalictrum thalictroides]
QQQHRATVATSGSSAQKAAGSIGQQCPKGSRQHRATTHWAAAPGSSNSTGQQHQATSSGKANPDGHQAAGYRYRQRATRNNW